MFVDNFAFENLGKNCPTCSSLGEDHLCGSHPQRPQQVQPGNIYTHNIITIIIIIIIIIII